MTNTTTKAAGKATVTYERRYVERNGQKRFAGAVTVVTFPEGRSVTLMGRNPKRLATASAVATLMAENDTMKTWLDLSGNLNDKGKAAVNEISRRVHADVNGTEAA